LLGLYEYALYAGHRALRLIPRWSLAYFSIAETCYYRKRWRDVIDWVERGRKRVPPATVCIVNPMDWRFHWMIHYTNALFHSGRIGDALAWTRQALEIRPQDSQHLANLRWFEDRVTPRRKVAGDCAHG
jgi:tetratricopeptide (TPR) repeat protein